MSTIRWMIVIREEGIPLNETLIIAKLNLIASKIAHEDGLVGQRVTWLVMSQSFLFGAFAALLVGVTQGGVLAPLLKLLELVIPFIGILLPFMVLLAVGAATGALSRWRAERARILATPEGKALDWPHVEHRLGLLFGQLLPPAAALGFMLAWVVILIQIETR
jgi:hypothetical protein